MRTKKNNGRNIADNVDALAMFDFLQPKMKRKKANSDQCGVICSLALATWRAVLY